MTTTNAATITATVARTSSVNGIFVSEGSDDDSGCCEPVGVGLDEWVGDDEGVGVRVGEGLGKGVVDGLGLGKGYGNWLLEMLLGAING